MKQHFDIMVRGRVQNVGFRYYTQKIAYKHNINGFVKNRPDGTVYIEAEGEPEALSQFISWCHHGPAWAVVQEVLANQAPVKEYSEFEIR